MSRAVIDARSAANRIPLAEPLQGLPPVSLDVTPDESYVLTLKGTPWNSLRQGLA